MKNYPELPATTQALEEEILGRWQAEDTFRQSLEQTREGEPFVFYEGPPTANGRPGIHHMLSRTIKDTVARYRTMQGRHVPRIAGWDTHGLPVEIEAEKKLGISGKRQIEEIGIARFNEVCRESVLTYTDEWERFSARIGYWLDYSRPYVTYHADYIESVWWLLSQIHERGLVFRGHKILPYCPRCGTGLSSHEVALGYKDVKDPSLFVTLPLVNEHGGAEGREFLVWTTTPWTLVSNVALAVNPALEYAEVEWEGRTLILVAARVPALFGEEARVLRTFPASEIVGRRYRRPFDWVDLSAFPDEEVARGWQVLPADFVSDADGTGIVHLSPAFGADDYAVCREHGLPVLQPVDDRGQFRASLPLVGGRFVKDADTDLVIELKKRGQVFRSSKEEHSYPHCWRCQSPLLYMARDSWFIRTTEVRDQLLANNAQIAWYPPEVGTGRFGEWLENNVDWAISRTRYWGTPLPFWVCDEHPAHLEVFGAFQDLRERSGLSELPDPHRPYVDDVAFPCRECGGTMRRTPEVVDVWFDSGSMPFAQHHFPFENREVFARQFPADFICEGVDQTRGWFYSLLAISTLLGDRAATLLDDPSLQGPAYRNVVVNDLILDAEGLKMSKSRGNVVNPWEAIDTFGADALRWYLLASSHPWLPKRFDAEGVREVQRKTFDTLRQTYRFFALYAGLEGWAPGGDDPAPAERSVLDRWLLSRLATVTATVNEQLDAYNLMPAVRAIADFVVDDLSNWYVRRSRDRFWGSADRADTRAAFATLHQALVTVSRLAAPFAPFLADWLHRALEDGRSVHLAEYPVPGEPDAMLEQGMELTRTISTLGRAAREAAGIKVRQPLSRLMVVTDRWSQIGVDGPDQKAAFLDILRDELNVHELEFVESGGDLVRYSAKPNFKTLGAQYGKRVQEVAAAVRAASSDEIDAARRSAGSALAVALGGERVELASDQWELVVEPSAAHPELVPVAGAGLTVLLDRTLTDELREEGLARELVNRVQKLRKDSGLEVSDRIRLVATGEPVLLTALVNLADFIKRETLTLELSTDPAVATEEFSRAEVDLDGVKGTIALARHARANHQDR